MRTNLGNDHQNISSVTFYSPSNGQLEVALAACPDCGRVILNAVTHVEKGKSGVAIDSRLWPDTGGRAVPQEVEAESADLAADFQEAAAVFGKSKKASAALARRCLQMILTTKGGAKKRDLADQIDEVLPKLPTSLAENVDAICQIGNFAAHPLKSKTAARLSKSRKESTTAVQPSTPVPTLAAARLNSHS